MPPTSSTFSGLPYGREDLDFIGKLQEFHKRRGTNFDPEPRVEGQQVDLLQLFNAVVALGGYDKVSDEKLAWRRLGQQFILGSNNLPALAFSLKSTYYKYLVAFEIATVHHKTPPPKEILEDVTARGGNVLSRTIENYRPGGTKFGGVGESGESGDEGTPVREHGEHEDTSGSGSRATRGLRQAPPQRVLFQPDTVPARRQHAPPLPPPAVTTPQPRGASTYNPPKNAENMSQTVANYEPRPQMPLTLRPVVTPGNNPAEFAKRQRILREHAASLGGKKAVPPARMMLPGTGFDGPNIYLRCLLALKSGIRAEQDYALHHLVKISMERGDKYKFESFLGLAEILIEKALQVSSMFYDVHWEITYIDDGRPKGMRTLDGLEGTPDILKRLAQLSPKDVDDNMQDEEFSDRLLQVNEAALTLRNMVMLEENALYVSELSPMKDFLCIALNLPTLDCLVELKHYALEIAEQLTKYLHLDAEDPLYLSLVAHLRSQDRGAILTSLRAISRIAMNLEENNRLQGISGILLGDIQSWILLQDEDLVYSCLDFMYQYTAVVENVDIMANELQLEALIGQLVRLLSHGAKNVEKEMVLEQSTHRPPPSEIPTVPQELMQILLKFDEPERSSHWLRCLFEEDKDESITQIALWQAYQAKFANATQEGGRPLLPAADFIKNVSTTFADKATAQVQSGPVQKFIIKGIRIRDVPVDLRGRDFSKCLWAVPSSNPPPLVKDCGEFFMSQESMYNHILTAHVGAEKTTDGRFKNERKTFVCRWKECSRYSTAASLSASRCASHIRIHLPSVPSSHITDTSLTLNSSDKKQKPSWVIPAVKQKWEWTATPVDERGDASGIPLSAVLVLRNLARNLPKTESEENTMKDDGDEVGLVQRLFKPVEARLWDVFAHNKSLAPYLSDLLTSISD